MGQATRIDNRALLAALRSIVGPRHLLTRGRAISAFTTGYRTGGGPCLAVARPGSLMELWRVLQACIACDAIIIMQAANTGLTGGSTPASDYDRGVIVINIRRLRGIRLLGGGRQVVCLPGASLNELERRLRRFDREPHSVIGSSCIGASVIGGVCNNSGGALVRRGPAYTELSLYARLNEDGRLELVNHLGLALGESPEDILGALDADQLDLDKALLDQAGRASDDEYGVHVRDIDADTPARFNADPRRLREASGCAGKIAVFAVRLDTFERERDTVTFYVGVNDPDDLTRLRRTLLTSPAGLPLSAEYLHRDAFQMAERYGKDMFLAIELLGADRMPMLNRIKTAIDAFGEAIGLTSGLSDMLLQRMADLAPAHLPRRMRQYRDRYEHHLLLKVAARDAAFVQAYLQEAQSLRSGAFFECTPLESKKAFLHRYVTAGAGVRYRAVHREHIADIVALDIALRRNDRHWFERLPPALDQRIAGKLYYGHFFCHVFHQDYLVPNGVDPAEVELDLKVLLRGRGAEYPAEHNVGHLYPAGPTLEKHYRGLDPLNVFNPGIGGLNKRKAWGADDKTEKQGVCCDGKASI